MTIVHISNIRGYNYDMELPHGEMLICTGGVCRTGTDKEVVDFFNWFNSRKHFYKIFVPGGEDWSLDKYNCPGCKLSKEVADAIQNYELDRTQHYLVNSSVNIEGIKIWGSPYAFSPQIPQAFQLETYHDAKDCWGLIPEDTDILLTSEAPKDICDWTPEGNAGCKELRKRVEEVKPKLHLFGGFLLSRGVKITKHTAFVNSASYDPVKNIYRGSQNIRYNNQSGKVTVYKEGISTYKF